MKKHVNHSETTATFTTSNGTTVRYQDVFKGIESYARAYAARNGRSYADGDMDDIFQDAALKAVAYHNSYDSDKKANPGTYGSRIAGNCTIDAFKSDMRHAVTFTSLESDFEEDERKADRYMFSGYNGDEFEADRSLRENEAADYIEEKIATLSEDYRTVISLARRDMDTEDIAETLDWDKDKVYRTLCRARAALAKALGKDFLRENGFTKVRFAS